MASQVSFTVFAWFLISGVSRNIQCQDQKMAMHLSTGKVYNFPVVPESQTGNGKDSLRHIGTIVSEHSHRQDFLVFITPLVKDSFYLLLMFAVAVFLSIYSLSLLRNWTYIVLYVVYMSFIIPETHLLCITH